MRLVTSDVVIVKSLAALMHQTLVRSHPHCSAYVGNDFMRSVVAKMVTVPKKRTNDRDQERMEICSFLVKA